MKLSGESFRHRYQVGYHAKRHSNLITDDEYFWARAGASARLYFSRSMRKRIFEYGCGIGQGIAGLPRAAGWDVSFEARQACRKRGLNVYSALSRVPRRRWDIVFCRHTLEHLERPLDALRTMRELLAPNGELFLVLPKERHSSVEFSPDLNQHLYCWNQQAINNLLWRAGFRPTFNGTLYVLGYRKLLPVYRLLGPYPYLVVARIVGYVLRNPELIIKARLA